MVSTSLLGEVDMYRYGVLPTAAGLLSQQKSFRGKGLFKGDFLTFLSNAAEMRPRVPCEVF